MDTAQTPSPEWIAAIILIGSMFMIIVLIMFMYASLHPERMQMTLTDGEFVTMFSRYFIIRTVDASENRDLEVARFPVIPCPPLVLGPAVLSALDSAAPARAYQNLCADDIDLPPDQSGQSVEWYVHPRPLTFLIHRLSPLSIWASVFWTNNITYSVICLEIFKADSVVRCLQCHHVFHAECIDKWLLKNHTTCPLCLAHYIPDSALPAKPPRVQPYPELRPRGPVPLPILILGQGAHENPTNR